MEHDLYFTDPQFDFVTTDVKFPAMVAGYGSGKTEAAINRLMRLKFENPRQDVAYYLPTYDLINSIAFPRIEEFLISKKIKYSINKNEKLVKIKGHGKIILRTMDRPERIVGYEVADSIADELDTLPKDKADDVWKKIIARNRQKKVNGKPNTVAVATTPEGFKFVHDRWHKRGNDDYIIIKASTYSNAMNLPPDYIKTLEEDYPAALLAAYLHGEFVNMAFLSVYSEFDREIHKTDVDMMDGEPLHIGMDFNVGKMAAVIHVIRDGIPYAVRELTDFLDTPTIITAIKERFPNRTIMVYPDASGDSRKSQNATQSDIALLRGAGFVVLANASNPFIRDRVLAVNVKLKKKQYFVNLANCPDFVDALEQQAYDKNGEPDKSSGHDHVLDAAGYFISFKYPVVQGQAVAVKLKGT